MSEEFINIVVSEPQKVEEGSLSAVTSYVTYKVSTETNRPGMSYSTVSVVRRYSDFVWLSEMLTLTNGGAIIPALPDKSMVSKFGTDFIESRKRSLEGFCTVWLPTLSWVGLITSWSFCKLMRLA